ncbi:MAG: cysteine desulfurase [Thermoanaerobaculia bacterium]|nr:cysteine desulfurase [Thermoanaerobaculia bacterium]
MIETLPGSATSAAAPAVTAALDVEKIRRDFPALAQEINGHPLAYLDNAASAQKPRAMIDSVAAAYARDYSNVHRGVHTLSQRATMAYEGARETVRRFVGAGSSEEIVFVRGATEGINLVARCFLRPRLGAGDEILVSTLEHHSNIVPWQIVCAEVGARLTVAPIDDRGDLDMAATERLLGERTRLVAMTHVSNALGTITPADEIVAMAHRRGVPVLLDGAQAVPHLPVDVAGLGCDFYVFSGHKLFGPTGIGALYGRAELLAEMPPYQGGGEMIRSVSFEHTEYAPPPHRFEAGTPNITGAIGLAASIDYLLAIGWEPIAAHEEQLLAHAHDRLAAIPGLRLIGSARHKAGVVSFVLEGVHAHDVGTILDAEGIAVRAGHHCAQPLMERFGLAATARASFAFYNTHDEVERLAAGIERALEIFKR